VIVTAPAAETGVIRRCCRRSTEPARPHPGNGERIGAAIPPMTPARREILGVVPASVHGKGAAPSASARPEESSGQTDAACGRPIPSTRKSCASRPPPVPLASLDQPAFPKPSAAAAGDTVGAQCLPLNAAAAAMSSTCWRPPTPPTSSMLCSHRRGTTSCARRSADQSDRTAGGVHVAGVLARALRRLGDSRGA
jgi:hypothetical protein